MKTQIGNWAVELHNDLVYIKKDGEVLKAYTVNPNEAIHRYNEYIKKVRSHLAKTA